MQELFFGKANSSTGKALKSSAQGQVLAFQALHGGFAHLALLSGQTGFIGSPSISKPLFHGPPGLDQHGQQAAEGSVGAPPKPESYYLTRCCFFHPLEPAVRFLAAHKRPPFVGTQAQRGTRLRWVSGMISGLLVRCSQLFFSAPITVCGLLPSTRAVSRMPLPCSARSVIVARTPGSCPWWR